MPSIGFTHFPSLLSLSRCLSRNYVKEESKSEKKRKKNNLERIDMDGQESEETKQSTADMTAFVQNLLQQMQVRFQTMSDNIISKIDEMGGRIDELEQSINDLRAEMGVEGAPLPSPPTKAVSSETKPAEGSS